METGSFQKPERMCPSSLKKALAQSFSVKAAVLKSNSPSCGSGTIYDGSFTGTLVPGDGVTAELLKKHGIKVTNENALL